MEPHGIAALYMKTAFLTAAHNQLRAISTLQATHENLKDDAGSTSTLAASMPLCCVPYMWLIFKKPPYT